MAPKKFYYLTCGMMGPQIISSSLSCTIINPPNQISPSITPNLLSGHVIFNFFSKVTLPWRRCLFLAPNFNLINSSSIEILFLWRWWRMKFEIFVWVGVAKGVVKPEVVRKRERDLLPWWWLVWVWRCGWIRGRSSKIKSVVISMVKFWWVVFRVRDELELEKVLEWWKFFLWGESGESWSESGESPTRWKSEKVRFGERCECMISSCKWNLAVILGVSMEFYIWFLIWPVIWRAFYASKLRNFNFN